MATNMLKNINQLQLKSDQTLHQTVSCNRPISAGS